MTPSGIEPCDLPTCSAVPQQTALRRAPYASVYLVKYSPYFKGSYTEFEYVERGYVGQHGVDWRTVKNNIKNTRVKAILNFMVNLFCDFIIFRWVHIFQHVENILVN